jgi:hypothetical protein
MLLTILTLVICGAGAVLVWVGYQVSQMKPLKAEDLDYIGYIILALGAGIVALGLLGLISTCIKSRCLLSSFTSFALLVGLATVGIGAALLYGREKVGEILKTEKDCAESSEFKYANSAVQAGDDIMCTDTCPCQMDPDLVLSYSLIGVDVVLGSAENVESCDPCSSIFSVLDYSVDCESSEDLITKYFTDNEQGYFTLLEWLENKFECSGICYPGTFYLFSDVNNGIPKDSCMDSLKTWLKEQLLLYGLITLTCGLVLILAVVLSLCMCCHPFSRKVSG